MSPTNQMLPDIAPAVVPVIGAAWAEPATRPAQQGAEQGIKRLAVPLVVGVVIGMAIGGLTLCYADQWQESTAGIALEQARTIDNAPVAPQPVVQTPEIPVEPPAVATPAARTVAKPVVKRWDTPATTTATTATTTATTTWKNQDKPVASAARPKARSRHNAGKPVTDGQISLSIAAEEDHPAPPVVKHRPPRHSKARKAARLQRQSISKVKSADVNAGEVERLLNRGEVTAARDLVENMMATTPQALATQMARARLAVHDGNDSQAIAILEAAIPLARDHFEVHGLLAYLYQKTKAYGQAAQIYQFLVEREPQRGRWWLGWAISLEHHKQTAEAFTAYLQASSSGQLAPSVQEYVKERLYALQASVQ